MELKDVYSMEKILAICVLFPMKHFLNEIAEGPFIYMNFKNIDPKVKFPSNSVSHQWFEEPLEMCFLHLTALEAKFAKCLQLGQERVT